MSSFYTNVANERGGIYLRGYEDGRRVSKIIPFRPYLYMPSKVPSDTRTIDGQYVDKVEFENGWEARNWIKQYEDVTGFKYYGMDKWPYVFIHDNYPGQVDYDVSQIKVACIDIEVDDEDGYPDLSIANKTITAITIGWKDLRIVFSYKDYTPASDKIKYIKCQDEKELLHKFLDTWRHIDADVITGWNISFFDIPYIINRITRELGDDYAKMLSPWNKLHERTVTMYGKQQKTFTPVGIAVLDYIDLYKKFTYIQRDSYALNNIAYIEVGEKKIDYSEHKKLHVLYREDFQKFIDYNIHDVDLVFKIDNKKKLIELVYSMAYDAKTNFSDTLTTVLYWDVLIYNYLADRNIVVPKYTRKLFRPFEGGYVKDPVPGMYKWVVSFDLTSLYPHLIMQYNIGPDTFYQRLNNYTVDKCLNRDDVKAPENYALAANGCLYRKDKQSFLAELMEYQFKQRTVAKDKMLAFKKRKEKGEDVDNEIARYDNIQQAKKIQLNSAYGAISNENFRYFDINNAEAITDSGRLSIRWCAEYVNNFLNNVLGTDGTDYIIAIDTDSLYVNLGAYADRLSANTSEVDMIDRINDFCESEIQPVITQAYADLAKQQSVYKNAMKMKREAIGDRAIWTAKKRYMINVLDNEGVRYKEPELKTTGIEAVRSGTPEVCRKSMKEAIKIIMSGDIEKLRKHIEDFRNEYYSMSFQEIATPSTANGLTDYADKASIYKKATPMHVRAVLMYNKLHRDRRMKTAPIFEGEKIKYTLLKMPNPTFENVIASSSGVIPNDLIPYIDYPAMFEKTYVTPLNRILDAINWQLEKKATLDGLF